MDKIPDAIKCPDRWKNGNTSLERALSLLDIVEPILATDLASGERAYMRAQPWGEMFVTKDIHDTLLFPKGHALEGRPRYNWVKKDEDVFYGYLVKEAIKAPVPPVAEVTNA
jgi:hypothetical protein